jgi:LysR family pca operon transcriptional activator
MGVVRREEDTVMSRKEPAGQTTMVLARRVRIRQLQIAVAVADHGSLLQASLSLGISQPSVTKVITGIEEILGVTIFDRLPRGVLPNEFGKAFIASARRIVAEINRVETNITQIAEGHSGALAIGALPSAASGLLPAILPNFRQAYPGIAVSLTEGTTDKLLPALQAGSLDLVAGRLYETEAKDDLRREVFYNEPLALMCRAGHPILRHQRIDKEHIQRFEFALPAFSQRLSQDVERAISEAALVPRLPLRSTSLACIREYVLGGDALTILPRLMMVGDLMRGDMAVVPFVLHRQERPAGIITLRHRQMSTAQKTFIGVMRSYLRESVHAELLDGNSQPSGEMRSCVSA